MEFPDFDVALDALLEADSRYDRAAYLFVREVLERVQSASQRSYSRKDPQVGAHQLLQHIRIHALNEFGPMTCTVFEAWGIRSCNDFGEIVFNMMKRRIVQRGPRDRREDFHHGFDFSEAFRLPFVPRQRQANPEMACAMVCP